MIIPHDQLQSQTLNALIEEFVTRHGAVHGHDDSEMSRDIKSVMGELRSGRAMIVFDEEDQSCSIVRKENLK